MEAYPNPRWRESNHHSNRLPPAYPQYHHQPPSPPRDIPPPEHRHWQRNGSLGPCSWNRGDSWPVIPVPPRPPLLPDPSENGYMRMHRKEREFSREECVPPTWLDSPPGRRRDFSFSAVTTMRRIESFQHDFNGPIRHPRYSHRPHDYIMSHNNDFQLKDSSPLSRSPAYSDPTSSPDTRTWDSSLHERTRDESLPRDPRSRPSHYGHHEAESSRRREPFHRSRPSTPPSRDPRRAYSRQSRSNYEKNRLSSYSDSHKRARSLDNGFLRSSHRSSPLPSLPSVTTSTDEPLQLVIESNDKTTSITYEVIDEDTSLPDDQQSTSPEVLKNVLFQIMKEHSYAKTELVPDVSEHIKSLSSEAIDTSTASKDSETESVDEREEVLESDDDDEMMANKEMASNEMDDDRSAGTDSSPVSLEDYCMDLGIDSDGFSTPPVSEDTALIVSIPLLIFSSLIQDVGKSVVNATDNGQIHNKTSSINDYNTLKNFEKTDNRLRKRIYRSQSKDEDSCSTTSSTSVRSQTKSKRFQDFVPKVLETRSRAEAATVRRRQKMEKEIEQNEREREATAVRNEELDLTTSPSYQDDSSSIVSLSSYQDSSSYNEEFSPEFIQQCKKTYYCRNFGSGDSILHRCCRTGKLKAARYYILMEGHKVNVQDNAGWTPLHEACNRGFSEIARALLENGADPNLPAFDGSRPIHDAIEAGSLHIVRMLVEYGSDFMVEQGEKTPIELARSLNLIEIVDYLEEIMQKRQKKKLKKEPSLPSPVTENQMKSKSSSSEKHLHSPVKLPFHGYTEQMLGPELDSPVIYISAIIEESDTPFLPLYNIKLSNGTNPRKHNFHLLTDILQSLSISRETLLAQLDVDIYTLSVGNFLQQLLTNPHTRHSSIIEKLQDVDITSTIELVPLCNSLRRLLNIEVANIDDY